MQKVTKLCFILIICVTGIVISQNSGNTEKWINVKGFGTDSNAIQKALNVAKEKGSVNVYIPKGVYNIKDTLIVYKNTHIIMDKKTILRRKHPGNFIQNGKTGDSYTRYNGNGNIIIEGGTLEGNYANSPFNRYGYGGINFAHANKIVIRGITIKDIVYSHAIEINSSKNVLIEDCNFLGYKDNTSDGSRDYAEAVQIDSSIKAGFPAFGLWDSTPSKKVVLKGNFFGNSGTDGMSPWPVGIGGHGAVDHIVIEDIKIINNTFSGMTYAGVRPYKWRNTSFRDNNFYNCTETILLSK